jgi:hypothetical protein
LQKKCAKRKLIWFNVGDAFQESHLSVFLSFQNNVLQPSPLLFTLVLPTNSRMVSATTRLGFFLSITVIILMLVVDIGPVFLSLGTILSLNINYLRDKSPNRGILLKGSSKP